VNEEIRLFRSLHGEGSILCVLAEGTPATSSPPALLEEGREPLAANLGESKESFRLGTTQLAASMLGVGLDVLIQRETKRRRRRLQLITASALVFSGIMGATALTAIDARNDAQDSRSQAEGLVEYMITDLKDKLEPLGKLDILDSVGNEAVKYYDTQNIDELSDESLTRQASARHILGQVALDSGNLAKARHEIETAANLTAEVLKRNPQDSEAIYAHAQSEYWVGKIYYDKLDYKTALIHWSRYNDLSQKNYLKDTEIFKWRMEAGYGENNLGNLALRNKDYRNALKRFETAIRLHTETAKYFPKKSTIQLTKANALAGAAQAALKLDDVETALRYRKEQITIYGSQLANDSKNFPLMFRKTNAQARIIKDGLLTNNSSNYHEMIVQVNKNYEKLIAHDSQNKRYLSEYKDFIKSTNQISVRDLSKVPD